jgi:hypothetical protein
MPPGEGWKTGTLSKIPPQGILKRSTCEGAIFIAIGGPEGDRRPIHSKDSLFRRQDKGD